MAYNKEILAAARAVLAHRREDNAAERSRRVASVYSRLPRVKAIDAELRRQMAALCSLTLSHDADVPERIEELREKNRALQRERAGILISAGLPENYTDDIYSCAKCRDTGYVGSEMCECLRREYNLALTRELSGLLKGGAESFANFRLDYYSAQPGKDGVSPRDIMSVVYETCRAYAANFSKSSPSLLFRGGPGLGKTFLSACIAREVAAKGYSVAYESAPTALGEFETQRFSRDDAEAAAASDKVKEYLGCDLMILDDLGTEMATTFTVSALYQLVNTRLAASKQTIISTNLGEEDILRRYGPQTASRLGGEFELLSFAGSDIRRLRKERGL